ncbi:MAG: tubulin-like doman-containing protein [Acidimicrobiales bacterium]
MLHPFLFIGLGGSGGKTLRTLHADLEHRLAEVGYEGRWPSCWQFLHIDVPTVADGSEPDLPRQLDEKDYLGLVARMIDYPTIDDSLLQGGKAEQPVLRNLLGWRPDPVKVTVPVTRGAGQHRALGRAITLANLQAVADAIRRATQALHGPQMIADLAAVSRAFGADVLDTAPAPEVVIVTSLAGGSGSGAFLDVCDVLRAVGGAFADESFALLYAPDVFGYLPPDSRKGVQANALASLCELMAGFWDVEPREEDFAILESHGIATGTPRRRGPRFPFIVGTRNDRVSFSHQNDVYRAMGKALAAWVVSEHLQQTIKSYATGNWVLSADREDRTQLRAGTEEQPLGGIGFARVSLGRDNFVDYASERLARGAVERVLRQHLADRPADADPSHDAAIEEAVTANVSAFLEASGLDERGEHRNQILDALRPPDRSERLDAATSAVHAALVSGWSRAMPSRQWLAQAIDLLREEQRRFASEEAVRRNELAREWVGAIQDRLVGLVARSVASHGAPVTERLLGRLSTELEQVLVELPDEEAKHRHWAQQLDEVVSSVLRPTNDAIGPDHPVLRHAIDKGIDCFEYVAEADLRRLSRALVQDLREGLITPLLEAVRSGRELLVERERSSGNGDAVVDRWPAGDVVPKRFHPAPNEFLLESPTDYPAIFRAQVTATATVEDPGGAEAELVRSTIIGSRPAEPDRQSLVTVEHAWVPAVPELQHAFGTSARARFVLRVEPVEILERARRLVQDPETPIGVFVSESLRDHLDPARVEPAELTRRLERFRDCFVQALHTSAPLVNVDPKVLSRVHGQSEVQVSYLFTEIPFAPDTPGYDEVRKVLESRGQWDENVKKAFSDGRHARIDVFSMLASAYNPVVFESIVGPIADEWSKRRAKPDPRASFWYLRRTRPLSTFVPVAPAVRAALIRGWFTARLLGQLRFDPVDRDRMEIFDPQLDALVPFPNPLLGPPVYEEYERLPAVLESMPVALVATVQSTGGRSLDDGARSSLRSRSRTASSAASAAGFLAAQTASNASNTIGKSVPERAAW